MRKSHQKRERGISLVMALLALMLLSAVAIGMMFTASTETAISSNFKAEETAYFAARAGVEEVRDRMLPFPPAPTSSYSLNTAIDSTHLFMPGANPWAIYVLNGGTTMADVTNLTSGKLGDDELCHDFYNAPTGMSYAAPNVKCTSLPAAGGWSTSTPGLTPIGGNNPLDYKWVRITLKANNSYAGSPTGNPNYSNLLVDSSQTGTNQVCWGGSPAGAHQVVVPVGTPCGDVATTPVYLLTALALTPSGGRRIVQQEVAQTYIGNPPGGLFADGTGCNALSLGGGTVTGSFNSATEAGGPTNPPSNLSLSGGDVGSNGNTFLGGSSTHVNGTVGSATSTTVGSCPGSGVTVSGGPTWGDPPGSVTWAGYYQPPIPPTPNPLPPTSPVNWKNVSEPAGSYGNVSVKGTVTLQGGLTASNPAIFTLNSLTVDAGATLRINGYVVLNLAGGQLAAGNYVLLMNGSAQINNTSAVPSAFVVNYGGSNPIKITGNSNTYAVINAPNSAVSLSSGCNGCANPPGFYGSIVGNTIDVSGGANFYWDLALQGPTTNTTTFHDIALRELSY